VSLRFTFAWLCVIAPLMSSLYAQVDDDHGNSCSSATEVSINRTHPGDLERAGDADYFQIQPSKSGILNVFTTGSTDTAGSLRDGNCSPIGSDDGAPGRNFRITQALSEGTHYVSVQHSNSSETGSYILHLEFEGSSVDLRVTSLSVSASSAQVGESVTVTWSVERGESDATAENFQHGIYLSNNTTISTSDTLLKENGPTTLGGGVETEVSGSDEVVIPDVSEGTYYIGYLVDTTGVVDEVDDETEENAENNNSSDPPRSIAITPSGCRTATILGINSSRQDTISSAGETDYFRIDLSSSGTLTAFTTGATDTVGNLRDSNCSTITSEDDGGLDTNFRLSRQLNGGTYYVSVRHSDPEEDFGSYRLHVEFQEGSFVLVANFVNGNDAALNSRVYLWNPLENAGEVTVRVFTLPPTGGTAQELTEAPLSLGILGAKSAVNIKVAEDILAPLGRRPYTEDGGDLTLEFTIKGGRCARCRSGLLFQLCFRHLPDPGNPLDIGRKSHRLGGQLCERQRCGVELACLSV